MSDINRKPLKVGDVVKRIRAYALTDKYPVGYVGVVTKISSDGISMEVDNSDKYIVFGWSFNTGYWELVEDKDMNITKQQIHVAPFTEALFKKYGQREGVKVMYNDNHHLTSVTLFDTINYNLVAVSEQGSLLCFAKDRYDGITIHIPLKTETKKVRKPFVLGEVKEGDEVVYVYHNYHKVLNWVDMGDRIAICYADGVCTLYTFTIPADLRVIKEEQVVETINED